MSGNPNKGRIKYTLTKLAPDVDMYEMRPEHPLRLDLESLGRLLRESIRLETSLRDSVLIVLFENLDVAAHIHPSGTIFLRANSSRDCIAACNMIFDSQSVAEEFKET